MTRTKYLLLCLGISGVGWLLAESFLAAPLRRRSMQQIKQDIVELFGAIIEKESKSIELKARVQQEACLRIRTLAENDKKSFFARASSAELQAYVQRLKKAHDALDQEVRELQQLLYYIQTDGKKDVAQ